MDSAPLQQQAEEKAADTDREDRVAQADLAVEHIKRVVDLETQEDLLHLKETQAPQEDRAAAVELAAQDLDNQVDQV